MKLATKYHGEIDVNEADIIAFANGLPAFEDETKFVVLPYTDDETIYMLQSVRTEGLAFILANPFKFFSDYEFDLDEVVVEQLQLGETQPLVFVMLSIPSEFKDATANLRAPIIIHLAKQIGQQVVLTEQRYTTKHALFNASLQKG